VLSIQSDITLDTAVFPHPAVARTYARTLYAYHPAGPPGQQTVPIPDIASGPPQLSADQRTYSFALRPGVRYAPPVNREVTATDFITAIERLYDAKSPPIFADLIAGAKAFGAGKAKHISGLAAPNPRTLQITLDQPAGDFLSILTLPEFAPVPGEYAANYQVGDNYAGHVVGTGPYNPTIYFPRQTIVLDRNPNWDPTTDPLRKAWVDRIQVKLSVTITSIQQAIEREEADLSLDSHVPQTRINEFRADPERSRRLSVNPTGSLLFLVLETNPKAGASPTCGSARRSTTPSTRLPTATPSPAAAPPPGSWPRPSWPRTSSATVPMTCTRPRAAAATPSRPERCWPRPATPTG
jgi:peptide/nickel transport system substrate-binding protein